MTVLPTEPTATAHAYDGVTIALRIEDGERVITVIGGFEGDDVLFTVDGDALGAEGELRRPAVGLPLQIASLVSFGPRPAPGSDPVVLLSGDDGVTASREALLAGWSGEQATSTALAAGADLVLWSLIATWTDAEGNAVARAMVVADGGDHGLATIEEREGGIAVIPRSSTEVWTQLSALLPRRFELA